jgi:P-loop Nucleotide Kinase3
LELVYLTGAPGAGKTTIMAHLTAHLDAYPVTRPRPAHLIYYHPTTEQFKATELGARRARFSGTDALPMNIQPYAVEWITQTPYPFVLAEGQRLANTGFLLAATHAGYQVTLAVLHATQDTLEARRAARDSHQDPTWLKAAHTRVNNLVGAARDLEIRTVLIPADDDTETVAGRLRAVIPILETLR